jgi:transposase-like protein
MGNELTLPKTLQEAIVFYSDPNKCLELLVQLRWADGVVCPHCTSRVVGFLATRKVWYCKDCRKQFSIKTGTYMEDSPLGLDKWLCAVWMITNAKNGVSSCEIARSIGVTQKSAWFMLHRIRLGFADKSAEKFSGTVEADETFVGGLEKNKHENKKLHAGRGSVGKTIVMGVMERSSATRKSQVRAAVIPNTSKVTLTAVIKAEVQEFTVLYTDAWKGYNGLSDKFLHEFVDHAVCYAIGKVHTNGIENFWSLLKRCLKGTYISVEPFHLEAYIDEQAFRFNHRGNTDAERFLMALGGCVGQRLTYDQLTSKFAAYFDTYGVGL